MSDHEDDRLHTTAYYSLVQYCPNRFRSEAVNVGLVLLRPEPHTIRARITPDFSRAIRLFKMTCEQLENAKIAVNSILAIIQQGGCELATENDLSSFASSRANDIRLTKPRLIKIGLIDAEFDRMFMELVD